MILYSMFEDGRSGTRRTRRAPAQCISAVPAAPWKSGPSGPRKAFLSRKGFRPRDAKSLSFRVSH